ncbi:YecA family protein [Flavobacterium luteolum]|uniref:YecA family protein n=1 Tax=Flavobacterium luteolum TaxID=3003259 RepID=UPI00248DE252|nr:SEC-C metal-binding domain-containing protein [Flavobacterium luteolum]
MAQKIGRNDLCPCGSGKKNKRCHNIDRLADIPASQNRPLQMETYVKEYDSHAVMNEIIGLQLMAENHGKNIRIEEIAVLAVKSLGNGKPGDKAALGKILQREYTAHSMEDPAENLFTENVVFFHGNHIAFPGIAAHAADIFLSFSQVIFNSGTVFPQEFTDVVYQGISLLLELGDKLAHKAGLRGNMEAIRSGGRMEVCGLQTDFSISEQELEELCRKIHVNPKIINQFILDGDASLDADDSSMMPLLFYPITHHNGRYYFTLISNQLNAINEFILRTALKFGCQELFLKSYRQELWRHIRAACAEMQWRETDIKLDVFPDANSPKEAIYSFDYNRLGYVTLDTPLSIPDALVNIGSEMHPPKMDDRLSKAANLILDDQSRQDCQMLSLQLTDSCGRTRMGRFMKPRDREYRLTFNVHDFLNLSKGEDWEKQSLWKFAKALAKFQSKTQTMVGAVELYSLYKHKSSGFYFSDDRMPDFLAVPPGEGSDLIRESKMKQNYHASSFLNNGMLGFLPVVSCGDFAPIYKPISHIGYFIESLESFRSPIWMTSYQVKDYAMAGIVRLYTHALSFWLDQMKPGLESVLDPLLELPIEIKLELDPVLFSSMTSKELSEVPKQEYGASFADNVLTFSIPGSSMLSFTGADNEGERELMRHTLKSFRLLGAALEDSTIEEILNKFVPLGQAKMMLFFDTQENLMIDRRWLMMPLLLSDAEMEMLLDQLPVWISERMEIPERIASREDKKQLFNVGTIVLIEKLKEEISRYENSALLKLLLNLHESIVQKREYEKTIIPAQLICFGNKQGKLDAIREDGRMLVRTSVSLRNLIEFVAAQPVKGLFIPSLDDVDRLLALMNEITSFGMMSDAIHFNMDDPEVGILPSGRIGFVSNLFSEKMEPFSLANAKADIDSKLEDFEGRFSIYQPADAGEIPVEVQEYINRHDAAFLADWEVSWSSLNKITYYASNFCIEKESSVITMRESDFIERLVNDAAIPYAEALAGIEKLVLSPRDSFLKATDGYSSNEVFPWKYNREFSLTRRPFVRHFNDAGDTMLSWGFRSAAAARYQFDFLLRGARLTNGGEQITKLISEYADQRGTEFRNVIHDWAAQQEGFEVIEYEVTIKPGGTLNAQKSYGDVDVFAFHRPSGTVFSLECKNTSQAKNIHEMKTEMDRYLGRDGKKGMVHKHLERHEWLNANLGQVQKLVKFEGELIVKSFMISSQVVPTPYIRAGELPMPIVAFPDLKREGVSLLF